MQPIALENLLQNTRSALIIIDVQNEFCSPEGSFAKMGMDMSIIEKMLAPLDRLIKAAHLSDVPVIFIQNVEDAATDSEAWTLRPDGSENHANGFICRRGSWDAEFYHIEPQDDDIVVEKHRFSAFLNTRLDTVLRAKKIETVVLTGVSSNVCVETTARHAVMLNYHVVIPEDACASWDREAHEMAMKNTRSFFGKVSDAENVSGLWRQRGKQN